MGKDEDCDGETDEMVGHGTHVAGIVDITAPAAKIMPLRVLDTEGYGDVFTIAKAVYFAAQNHTDVINLSLGSPSRSKLLQEVIKDATASGVLVAAAAGNSNSTVAHYPAAGNGVAASTDGLVAVTSVNMYDQKSDFANYGGGWTSQRQGRASGAPSRSASTPTGAAPRWQRPSSPDKRRSSTRSTAHSIPRAWKRGYAAAHDRFSRQTRFTLPCWAPAALTWARASRQPALGSCTVLGFSASRYDRGGLQSTHGKTCRSRSG